MANKSQTAEEVLMEVVEACVDKPLRNIVVIFCDDDDIVVKSNTSNHHIVGMCRYAQIRAEAIWKD